MMADNRPKVSVVIPVYNTREYLPVCLNSVANQTIGAENLEIIVVDDGSTDGSVEYLKEFAERHKNVTAIYLPQNTGSAGYVRNIGIKTATGEWIYFVDSDDWLGAEALEKLVKHAEEWDSDVVQGRMKGVDGAESYGWTVYFSGNRPSVMDGDLAANGILTSALGSMRLIRTDLIKRKKLLFSEDTWFEDAIFILEVLFSAERVSLANDYDYYFVRRDAARRIGLTQTTTTSPIRRPERIVKGIEKLFDVIDRYSVHPAQYLKILKKLFSYQLGQAFIQINAHAMQWPDQYQDAGIVYKKQVWERVQRYYTPELNAIMSIPAAIRCDYTQKEVFDESEIGVLAFCKPVKMNSLKLFKQKSNTFRKAKRLPELEVLSEITWDRLYKISCEAAVFCVIDVVCKESNKIVVKGTYKYPLLITEKPEIFPALQCGDTLITAESVSFNEDFWGEPWQGCGRWQAAFSNLEQADIAEPVFKLGFCFYHDKEQVAFISTFRDNQLKERMVSITLDEASPGSVTRKEIVLDLGILKDEVAVDTQLKMAKSKIKKIETENKNLKQKVKKTETKTKDLQQELTAAETVTKDLQLKLTTAETETKGLQQKLTVAETETKDLQLKLTTAETETKGLQQKLTAAETETKDLQLKLCTANDTIEHNNMVAQGTQARLRNEVKKFKLKSGAVEKELKEIKNSRSWKLTRPLRFVGRWTRKLLQR